MAEPQHKIGDVVIADKIGGDQSISAIREILITKDGKIFYFLLKLTKQDIQDTANGYTIKYVSNSFIKDELIIELVQLCLQAIDEKEELLSQLDELDEEE